MLKCKTLVLDICNCTIVCEMTVHKTTPESWIKLCLTLTMVSGLNGGTWTVSVPKQINSSSGLNVSIKCSFSYPDKKDSDHVQIFWKKKGEEKINIEEPDKNQFIFHPTESYIIDKYRRRTALTGNGSKGDCSLQIQNMTTNEHNIYLRVHVANEKYSFIKYPVSIIVNNEEPVPGGTEPTEITGFSTPSELATTPRSTMTLYLAISVPLAAVFIVVVTVTGFVLYKKHARSRSLNRTTSGYYANFSRGTMDQTKSKTSCLTQTIAEDPGVKIIDEPVYSNLQPSGLMETDESIYANVDYQSQEVESNK